MQNFLTLSFFWIPKRVGGSNIFFRSIKRISRVWMGHVIISCGTFCQLVYQCILETSWPLEVIGSGWKRTSKHARRYFQSAGKSKSVTFYFHLVVLLFFPNPLIVFCLFSPFSGNNLPNVCLTFSVGLMHTTSGSKGAHDYMVAEICRRVVS